MQRNAVKALLGSNGEGARLGQYLSETPLGDSWRRQDRWTRLTDEEVALAVEILPEVHQKLTKKGEKKKPMSTLLNLLDVLCGAAGKAKGAGGGALHTPWRGQEQAQVQGTAQERAAARTEAARAEEERAAEAEAARLAALHDTPISEQWEAARPMLRMLVRDERLLSRIEAQCCAGALSAAQLVRDLRAPDRREERLRALAAALGVAG